MLLYGVQALPDENVVFCRLDQQPSLFSVLQPDHGVALPTHPRRRMEWMAGRFLLKELLARCNPRLPYLGTRYDAVGRPLLVGYDYAVSLAHSFPYVAAQLAPVAPVGVDIQRFDSKLVRVASRVLRSDEKADAGDDLAKLAIYWCAKEAMFKQCGCRGLSWQDFYVKPFVRSNQGRVVGFACLGNGSPQRFSMAYRLMPDAALVYTMSSWVGEMMVPR